MPLSKKYIKSRQAYQVTFQMIKEAVPAEEEIRLLGDFNSWNWETAPILKLAKGNYKTTIELPAGNAIQFRYKSGNGNWYNDHSADDYVQAPFDNVENCLVYLPEVKEEAAKPKKSVIKSTSNSAAKKTTKVAAKPEAKVAAKAVPKKAIKVAAKPVEKAAAKTTPKKAVKTAAVNFTKIEGIGPKIAGLIKDAKITSYEALATSKKKDLQSILDNAGKRYAMHDPSTWAKQSKLLAQGKLKELKTLQDKLKGGKA
ncbi:MAG: putative flap endonuclease-1-like 5' DNA nuclease [Saprospiraceae bacterium]|jgi:predicted flap endonuclease-1-like 5' DNA nuclease